MSEKIEHPGEEVDTDLLLPVNVNAEDVPAENPSESPEFDDSEPMEA